MEFSFKMKDLFHEEISLIDSKLVPKYLTVAGHKIKQYKDYISIIIDNIGKASAEAQGLATEITSTEKLLNTDNRIYLKVDLHINKVIGYIKVGTKNLFLFDTSGEQHEFQPLCVLDFYVHESMQRKGCGKQLFDYMILKEKVEPHQLAINRPSAKFLSFLMKHYSLSQTIPQTNKFVIFKNFFLGRTIPVNRRQWNYDDDDNSQQNSLQLQHRQNMQSATYRTKPEEMSNLPPPYNRPRSHIFSTGNYGSEENIPKQRTTSGTFERTCSPGVRDLKPTPNIQCNSYGTNQPSNPKRMDTAWNIFGVPGVLSNNATMQSNQCPRK